MPISHSDWWRSLDWPAINAAFKREEDRWNALPPAQREREEEKQEREKEKLDKHLKWLDWCAANKISPHLAKLD